MLEIITLLLTIFKIWESKEKTKYVDRTLELQKIWYSEISKPQKEQNMALIDNCEMEIRQIARAVSSLVLK